MVVFRLRRERDTRAFVAEHIDLHITGDWLGIPLHGIASQLRDASLVSSFVEARHTERHGHPCGCLSRARQDVDGRDKPGHDAWACDSRSIDGGY